LRRVLAYESFHAVVDVPEEEKP
jgi:hypothetical protein